MVTERRVKLFRFAGSQLVQVPEGFELPGEDAIMHKEGDRLIIEPARPTSLLALLDTLTPLDETFPPIPDVPVDPSVL